MKVGDKMFGFRFDSIGINAVWLEEMSEFIGKIGIVDKIQDGEVCLKFEEDDYIMYLWYPIPNDRTEELLKMLKKVAERIDNLAVYLQDSEMYELAEEIKVLIEKK